MFVSNKTNWRRTANMYAVTKVHTRELDVGSTIKTMKNPTASDVKKGIAVLWETLQCPICLDLMMAPVSTKCDHQFCKFCMMKLLDSSKQNRTNCPICKAKITKRSLQESPGFQRLVAGLQDIIEAYEHDTGTNYFTGVSLKKRPSSVTDGETTELHNMSPGDSDGADRENEYHDDLPQSLSSTVAAQNGFARLMGLEDSVPLTTDNEGLDSGLGDAPPTSDKKISSPSENLEPDVEVPSLTHKARSKRKPAKLENASALSALSQDESGHQLLRKSSRKKQKKDFEPGEILEQKKKKSLQKVAEWLMSVPVEGQLENPGEDSDASDSCSSTSTLDVKLHYSVNHKNEDRNKALEEQVFGAIYKRKGNKAASPPLQVFVKQPTAAEMETHEDFSEANKNNLLPFAKNKEMLEDENGSSRDLFKETQMQFGEEHDVGTGTDGMNKLSESEKTKDELEVHHLASVQQQPETRSKKRSRATLQQVDTDLQAQAQSTTDSAEQRKADRGKGKNAKSQRKPAKAPKPLVLVGAHNGDTSPKARERSEEVQVQIENYPSSEEQDVPLMRSTRRSKRLQRFAVEVQETHKKADIKAGMPQKDPEQSKDAKGKTLDDTAPPASANMTRNGCVYEHDVGGIESMEAGERASDLGPAAEVPHAQDRSEVGAACSVSVVQNSTSPSSSSVVGPTLENKINSKPDQETSVGETENEEDKNDSELDTEQLLRSFKATKRKSFHLGQPKLKKTRPSDDPKAEENHLGCSGVESAPKQILSVIPEPSSSCDLIPPSISPIQTRKTCFEKSDEVVVLASNPESSCSGQDSTDGNCLLRDSPSSGLSPNRVAKGDRESPSPSIFPQVVDSGLHFTAVEHEELTEAFKGSQVTEDQPDRTSRATSEVTEIQKCLSASHAENMVIAESSLTPEGLLTSAVQFTHETKTNANSSGDASIHSSVNRNPRTKRRAQRLDSSSDSNSSDSKEELPTLAKILGTSAPPTTGNQEQGESGQANKCEDACVAAEAAEPDSVDSSQASVDLFGTPDECDVQANGAGVSMGSSQFSSEVLVTQQKIEMKNELVRLEKLMALVSEVLQEKESSPVKEVSSKTRQSSGAMGPCAIKPLLSAQEPSRGTGRNDIPDVRQDPQTGPSGDKLGTEPSVLKHGGISEKVEKLSTHTGLTTSMMPVTAKPLNNCSPPSDGQEGKENNSPPKDRCKAKLVLVSSGLGPNEQTLVKKFAKRVGARVVSQVTAEVTHIIMRTDEQLVCERTLKYFLGIAGRKWMVSFQWISECFKQKKLLEESPFEVRGDVVNGPNHQGPSRARTTKDVDLLLKGYKIYFQGPFTDMTTDEMEWMVELCGATVVKDPLLLDSKQKICQLAIVQPRPDSSSSTYSSLSRSATVVTRGWLLDTVATYTLQNYSKYTT
ncbi:uncharacterized protein ACNS7B_022408 isoform 1-T1 [Menidia menidia]